MYEPYAGKAQILNFFVSIIYRENRYKTKPEVFRVVVGQVSLTAVDPSESNELVSAVLIHEKYDPLTYNNNIAMLQVSIV